MAKRLAGRYGYPEQPHHFDVTVHESQFDKLYRWNKPRMVFVCSMGDLFHEDVPENVIRRIFNHFRVYDKHTYQVLTKRPKRMSEFYSQFIQEHCDGEVLENVWLGITAENQETADERIPWLLKTPAAVRFVSVEPMLGPLLFRWAKWMPIKDHNHLDGLRILDWVICGGETGPGARITEYKWVEDLFWECKMASIPFFFKKVGDNPDPNLVGAAITEYRQWPNSPIANNHSLPGGLS
jgi:protein gp37